VHLQSNASPSPPPPRTTHTTTHARPAGGELWVKIRRGEYNEARAARLVREVLRAVAQCHAKGIVIRDVKPENFLFLNEASRSPLKMIDFGIATYCQPGECGVVCVRALAQEGQHLSCGAGPRVSPDEAAPKDLARRAASQRPCLPGDGLNLASVRSCVRHWPHNPADPPAFPPPPLPASLPGEHLTSRAGTPIYLSPELVRQHYGPPTDLWSTGILAYQLLTGRLPFSDPDGSEASESYMSRQVGAALAPAPVP
jgi:serine/threonine protein kinase